MSKIGVRRAAMQLVYARLMGGTGDADTLSELIEYTEADAPDALSLADAVTRRQPEWAQAVARFSPERAFERIPSVPKAILFVALYELNAVPDTPAAVAISEAVEAAKRYAGEADARFVNGLLGAYQRARADA